MRTFNDSYPTELQDVVPEGVTSLPASSKLTELFDYRFAPVPPPAFLPSLAGYNLVEVTY